MGDVGSGLEFTLNRERVAGSTGSRTCSLYTSRDNPKYAEIIGEMKTQLKQTREQLNETDNNSEFQAIIEKH